MTMCMCVCFASPRMLVHTQYVVPIDCVRACLHSYVHQVRAYDQLLDKSLNLHAFNGFQRTATSQQSTELYERAHARHVSYCSSTCHTLDTLAFTPSAYEDNTSTFSQQKVVYPGLKCMTSFSWWPKQRVGLPYHPAPHTCWH